MNVLQMEQFERTAAPDTDEVLASRARLRDAYYSGSWSDIRRATVEHEELIRARGIHEIREYR